MTTIAVMTMIIKNRNGRRQRLDEKKKKIKRTAFSELWVHPHPHPNIVLAISDLKSRKQVVLAYRRRVNDKIHYKNIYTQREGESEACKYI